MSKRCGANSLTEVLQTHKILLHNGAINTREIVHVNLISQIKRLNRYYCCSNHVYQILRSNNKNGLQWVNFSAKSRGAHRKQTPLRGSLCQEYCKSYTVLKNVS